MPRGFNENEISIIIQKLDKAALQSLKTTGIRKTTVDSLAKEAGISKGAFYKFYNSKEELFFRILESQEELMENRFINMLDNIETDVKEQLKCKVKEFFYSFEVSEYLFNILQGNIEYLTRALDPKLIMDHANKDIEFFKSVLYILNIKGLEIKMPESIVTAYVNGLMVLIGSKEIIGEKFDDVFTGYIDMFIEKCISFEA